jgi:hypothetical protein
MARHVGIRSPSSSFRIGETSGRSLRWKFAGDGDGGVPTSDGVSS